MITPEKNCKICNNLFVPTNDWNIYCSKNCRIEASHIRSMKEYTCLCCKKKFKNYKPNKKFCSLRCNYLFKQDGSTGICEYCNKTFIRQNKIERFCSRNCFFKSSSHKLTKIEKELYTFLQNTGIEFEKQKNLNYTIPDAYIPELNLCIYVDGEYWHTKTKVAERDSRINTRLEQDGYDYIRIISQRNKINFDKLEERLKVKNAVC